MSPENVPPSMDFAPFSTKYSPQAQALRRVLPTKSLQALLDVLDELAQEPLRYKHRVRPISRDGKTYLYTHPEPLLEITFEIDAEAQVIYFLHFAAPMLQPAKALFVSYSHRDATWLAELRKWLEPLEQLQLIKIWDDSEIRAGSIWEKEIEKSLEAAKAALLLVSDNFMASKFIATNELPKLLEAANLKGVLILWLAIGKITQKHADLSQYQALYDPDVPLDSLDLGARQRAWGEIFEKTKSALQS